MKQNPFDDAKHGFFVKSGEVIALIGRTEDGSWYRIQSVDSEANKGWYISERLDLVDEAAMAGLPVATSTATPTNTPTPTITPIPTNTPDLRGEYEQIDIRELDAYTSRYIGDKVRLRGRVFNIMSDGLQMWVGDVAVVVSWDSIRVLPDQVYEDTWITVYGGVLGTFRGTNAFGGTIEQPWITADIVEK